MKFKKAISLILALSMILSLAACGSKTDETDKAEVNASRKA